MEADRQMLDIVKEVAASTVSAVFTQLTPG